MNITQLLDECRNHSGPLPPDMRQRLIEVINKPSIATWEAAHGIIIRTNPTLTLWQAWIAIDPQAPRVGRRTDFEGNLLQEWQRIPDALSILRALKYAAGLKGGQ